MVVVALWYWILSKLVISISHEGWRGAKKSLGVFSMYTGWFPYNIFPGVGNETSFFPSCFSCQSLFLVAPTTIVSIVLTTDKL